MKDLVKVTYEYYKKNGVWSLYEYLEYDFGGHGRIEEHFIVKSKFKSDCVKEMRLRKKQWKEKQKKYKESEVN